MLKFFRRIRLRLLSQAMSDKVRRKLLDEGSVRKYLLYAVGEIVLVMIGILLALQVNNWNETRKTKAAIDSLLDAIETDLVHNIEQASSDIDFFEVKDSLTHLVLTQPLTKQDYLRNPELILLAGGRSANLPINENIVKLIEKEEAVPAKYRDLIVDAKKLEIRLITYLKTASEWDQRRKEIRDFRALHIPLLANRDSVTTAKKIEFYLTNESYKSQVSLNWIVCNNLRMQTHLYRHLSLQMLINLKSIRNNFDKLQIENLLNNLNFFPFHEVQCQDVIIPKQRKAQEHYTIINLSGATKELSITNIDGQKLISSSYSIEGGEIALLQSPYQGIEGEKGKIVTIMEEGDCIKKFVTRRNGYLIIE